MNVLDAHGVKHHVAAVAFTPDGHRLVVGTADGFVRGWDLSASRVAFEVDRRPPADHRAVTLTPDGRALVTGDGPGVRLWDAATGAARRTLAAGRGNPGTVAVSPDGREILIANDAMQSPGLLRWDASGADLPPWAMPSPIYISRLAFSPDGRWLAGHAGAGVTVWDLGSRAIVFTSPEAPTLGTAALCWSPDGRLLASGCGNALPVWDVADGREVARLKLPRKHFQSAAFSPDGRTVVTVSNEATARLWDVAGWSLRSEYAWAIGSLKCVAFAPDGLRAAAGGEKGRAVVWDV